jgi:dipeptidyl aminopeptidase/acylaminoacyl peptidase
MRTALVVSIAALTLAAALGAQSPPPITRADYGQWESVSLSSGGAFSPDGQWLAYNLNRVNQENELRLVRLGDDDTTTVAFGSQPVFSATSTWVAYRIGHSPDEQERLRDASEPVRSLLGLTNLATGDVTTIETVRSFAFSRNGRYLAIRRYGPSTADSSAPTGRGRGRGGRGGGGAPAASDAVGVVVLVRDLETGRDTAFGNVSDFVWQDADGTHLLAMTISADGRTGNGVHLFDPATGALRVLDSSASIYSGLTWREDQADLAVRRSTDDDGRDGPTHTVLLWRGLGATSEQAFVFDPTNATDFPADMRTVSTRALSWSEDGRQVFMGVAAWDEKEPDADEPDADEPDADEPDADEPDADEPADVDIWHWTDTVVMARQKTAAAADRRRSLLAVWHVDDGRFVELGRTFDETVTPIPGTNLAYVEEWSAYAMQRSIGRPAADLYLADLSSGERTALKTNVDDRRAAVSAGGRYVLFVEDNDWWTIDLDTRAISNITGDVDTSFIDLESDSTGPAKPAFGVAGWTADDAAVILYDALDLWRVSPTGAGATRLTDGSDGTLRHRYARVDPNAEIIDLESPVYLSLFGLRSKQSGYGRLEPDGVVTRLILDDQRVTNLSQNVDGDVFAYVAQAHDDSPDIFVGGPGLSGARQVTTTNAFQSAFAWSRSETVEFTGETGVHLQGALYYPAGYEPDRVYPMIVYLYERLSDNVHRYVTPSERSYYNTTVFTSQGYFVFQPDIVFRPGEPGLSVVESVRPAVTAVVDTGMVAGRRVGVVGHSWGGFDASFLATHTATFAAAEAGAPITNLVSNYGNHHWSSGIAETDHIETGQQRMVVPLYDDLDAYIRNSAVFAVQNMTTPLLLEAGDNDGTVFWHQAVELYNIARRAGKTVVMLVYNGEDHGLRTEKNQIDYQQRILDWFGHYLKDEPAKPWISEGRSFLEREPGLP